MADDDKDTSNNDELDTGTDDVETPGDQEEDEGASDDNDDEANDEDESNDEDDDESDDDDSDDDDSDEEDEDDSEFKKAFSQIKGDTPEEYIPNLEDAYRKSTAEGKRLAQSERDKQSRLDQINAAVAKNPELAKLIMEATEEGSPLPTVEPGVLKARNDYEEKVASDLETFLDEHNTLANDETLMDEFMENVATLGAASLKKGKVLDPMLAYKKALGMMDYDNSKDKQDKLVDAAKKSASKPKTPAAAKPKAKSGDKAKLTTEQIAYGKKFGLTEKQLLATLDKKS